MGKRYEKSKKDVSENRQTLERLGEEGKTLREEYAPLGLLDSIQSLLDDEASDAIQEVKNVGEIESRRIEEETGVAEGEKREIIGEINGEVAKLNSGLEKLQRASGIEFGKRAVEQSSQEYKKQIQMFRQLLGELGETGMNSGGVPEMGASATSETIYETPGLTDSVIEGRLNRTSFFSTRPSNVIFTTISPTRSQVAELAFNNAPRNIVEALNHYAGDLRPTADTGYSINEFGQRVKDGCYYSPDDHQVRMDETLSDEEYSEILPHELSHFLDHERGWESRSDDFVNAVQSDRDSMDKSTPEGRARLDEMLDDAFSTGAAFDRNVSDIISAVFENDPEIVQRFHMEGVPYYQHSNAYWARPFSREAEIYANNGAVRCSGERVSNNFLERYFPNSYRTYDSFYQLND